MIACFHSPPPRPLSSSPNPSLSLKSPSKPNSFHLLLPPFKPPKLPRPIKTPRAAVLKESSEVDPRSDPHHPDEAIEAIEGGIEVNGFEVERVNEEAEEEVEEPALSRGGYSSRSKKRTEEIEEGDENRFKLRNGREVFEEKAYTLLELNVKIEEMISLVLKNHSRSLHS